MPFRPPGERERQQWRGRHTCVRGGAASKSVSMIAVGGDNVVIIANRSDSAGHTRFLTDVKVTKATDLLPDGPLCMQTTNRKVKTQSLMSELRKNIQLGVALY